MSSMPASHDGAHPLYAAVRHHLKSVAADLTSAESTSHAIGAALSIVSAAVADFAEEWNRAVPSVLDALPPELLVECFSWLSPGELVIASGVSRSWRATMLAAPRLWSHVWIPHDMLAKRAVARFRNLIARSGSASLDVQWFLNAHDGLGLDPLERQDVRELFARSISRIRTLTVGDRLGFDFLSEHKAPELETLEFIVRVRRNALSSILPARWVNTCAPRLRSISMGAFAFPQTDGVVDPMRNVEVFKGQYRAAGDPAARNLFTWFPCLVSLTLTDIKATEDLPQQPAPPTLRDVQLEARGKLDFSPVFRRGMLLHTGKIRTITIETWGVPAVAATLEYLATPAESCGLSLRYFGRSVTLGAVGGSHDLDLKVCLLSSSGDTQKSWSELRGSRLPLRLIHSLFVDEAALVPMLLAELYLPGVHSLTVADIPILTHESAIQAALVRRDTPALRVPNLREITFNLAAPTHIAYSNWTGAQTASQLAAFVARRVRLGDGKLDRVTIIQHKPLARQEVSGLLAHAHKVFYRDGSGDGSLQELTVLDAGAGDLDSSQGEQWDEEHLDALASLFTDALSA